MRILHAIQSIDIKGGGPVTGVLQLAAADTTHQHEIVSLDAPDAECVQHCPVPVTALGPTGFLGYTPRLTPWIRRFSSDFDAFVIHGLWRYLGIGVRRGLSKTGVPYFVQTHGMLDPWFNDQYPLKKLKKSLFWRWTEYRVLRDAQAVVSACEEERIRSRDAFSPYVCKEVVIPFGIHEPAADPEVQRRAFLERFPEVASKRFLLYLGRIQRVKGCDLLLNAFAELAVAHPELHLVVAGPDQEGWGRELTQLAAGLGVADRITWTGMVQGDVKWGALRCADALVLPSHHENFGFVVVEAFVCGVPVLISRNVQIWREVVDAGAGLAEADDLCGTRAMIQQWLAMSPEDREAMRRRARECFERNYRVVDYVSTWHRLLERTVRSDVSATPEGSRVVAAG